MNYDGMPQHVLVKLLALEEGVEALSARAGTIERDIENRPRKAVRQPPTRRRQPAPAGNRTGKARGRSKGVAAAVAGRASGFIGVQGLA
jgi:hypothetical protein